MLVTAICVFILLGVGGTMVVLRGENLNVRLLTTVIGPARDENFALLQAMTDAQAALALFEATHDPAQGRRLADAGDRTETAQDKVRTLLVDGDVAPDQRQDYARLQAGRDDAVAAWKAYADRAYSGAVAGRPPAPEAGVALFDRFRTTHAELADELEAERDALRSDGRGALTNVAVAALLATAVALLGSLLMARRTARSLTTPIARLRAVLQRIAAGDTGALADENHGAREMRDLAAGFNVLTAHNNQLLAEQAAHVAELERLDEQKDDFLSTVSHELRTPLTSISGYLELLMDDQAGEVGGTQRRMLDIMHRNTARLEGLIEDLLVMNHVFAGVLHLEAQLVPVAELLEQAVGELRSQADGRGVELQLPAGESGSVTVLGDRAHLRRAVLNVIGNAVKFTSRGGTVRVTYTTDPATREVIIRCQDTGIGIPEADLGRVTNRFFRASNTSATAIPGTGLGLAIVEAIVDAHKGQLLVDSTEGTGTTMTLRFPAAPHATHRDQPSVSLPL